YTSSAGCSATKVITVNPLPPAITGTMSLCVGSSITLSDATTGGTWTSGSTGIATVGSATGVVTGVTAGTAVITYTAGGCSITATVTVMPISAGISGPSNVCVGYTITLTDATSGGIWTSTSPGVATIGSSTGIVTGISTGVTVISYSLGMCSSTKTVTVNPLPLSILGIPSVCVGQTNTLFDGTAGGTWSSSNTAIATVGSSTGTVIGISGGTVTISYTLGSGCFSTIMVTVNSGPPGITGTLSICVGATIPLFDATSGGV